MFSTLLVETTLVLYLILVKVPQTPPGVEVREMDLQHLNYHYQKDK